MMGLGSSSRSRRQTGTPEHNNNSITYNPDGADGVSIRTAPMDYVNYKKQSKSMASFKKLFRRRRWRKSRGSLSASFNFKERDMKVTIIL